MTRRGLTTALAAALAVGVVLAPAASAVKPARQGWWRTSINVGGVDLTALIDPSTVDVPADGMLVAGGSAADQPQAIAAVAYDVAGTVAGPLRLTPHAATATVPGSGAMACPLDEPTFTPAQGGLITDAPRYDCLGAVVATVDADGAYVFDVSTLVRDDAVAVAILPTSTTSRIVFAAPADDSLAVTPALPAGPGPTGGSAMAPGPRASGTATLPSATVDAASAVAPDAQTPAEAAAATDPSSVAAIGAVQAAARGSAGRAYLLLALAAAAGLAWAYAGVPRRARAAG
jgi:hypothetical protein